MKKLLMVLVVGLVVGSAERAKFTRATSCGDNDGLLGTTCISADLTVTTITTTDKKKTAYIQQQEFVAVTIDNISEDIAQGGGPHLRSLAALLGCPASNYPAMADMARRDFARLFPSAETEPEVFLTRLKDRMRDNPSLADRCVNI